MNKSYSLQISTRSFLYSLGLFLPTESLVIDWLASWPDMLDLRCVIWSSGERIVQRRSNGIQWSMTVWLVGAGPGRRRALNDGDRAAEQQLNSLW